MDADAVVAAVVAAIAVMAAVVAVLVGVHVRRMRGAVRSSSIALAKLSDLNSEFERRLPRFGPIKRSFSEQVNSKAKFDRCDLGVLALQELEQREAEIQQEVALRLNATGQYSSYSSRYAGLVARLGESQTDGMDSDTFNRIETKLFQRGKLPAPDCRAAVRVEVRYRSPKGKNSYSKSATLNFDQLVSALNEMRRIRDERSSAYFLRQRERSRMSAKLRTEVLRRDRSRCRMCGRTADVVPLHVDHVIPVSKGGKSSLENLQTLCQDCNLGKSNRF